MELNTMQNFWQKGIHSPFWILASRGQKNPKSQKALTHPMKNLVFWIELNTPMKIFTFCILSFQSSLHFALHGELNTANTPMKILAFCILSF
jgi:hypothetical protein